MNSLSEEQILRERIAGDWSVKDMLAHITWWERAVISEIVHRQELDPGNGEPWSTDRANALIVAAKRNTPLPQVLWEDNNCYACSIS